MAVAYAPLPTTTTTTSSYHPISTTTTTLLPFNVRDAAIRLDEEYHHLEEQKNLFNNIQNLLIIKNLQRQPLQPQQHQQQQQRRTSYKRQNRHQTSHREWDELDTLFNRPSLKPVAAVQPSTDIDLIHQTPVNKRNAGKSTDVFIAPPSTDGKARGSAGRKSQQRSSQQVNDENEVVNQNASRHATPAASQSRRTSQQIKSRQATPAASKSPLTEVSNSPSTRSQRSSLQQQQSATTSDDNVANDDTEIPMTMPRKSMMPMHHAASPITFDAEDEDNANAVDSMMDEMMPTDDSAADSVQTPATQKKSSFVAATDVNVSDDMQNEDTSDDMPSQPEFEMNDNADDSYDQQQEEDDEQPSKEPTPAKKVKVARPPRQHNGQRKNRRQTYQIVEENAKLIEIVHDSVDEDTGVRRSGRSQRAPLAYWTTEHIIYKRGRTEEGMDRIMGSPEYVPPVKTPAKESEGRSKKNNKSKKQRN